VSKFIPSPGPVLPRQAIASERATEWRDLDLRQDRQSALTDPVGFVSFDGLMVIDEIQRAPELLLAIKARVDADPRPGQFLLTGSSRLPGLRDLPDTLPGRMETVELWPFSQGEIDRTADSFVDTAFRLGPDLKHASLVTRAGYSDRLVRGGLPEAVARTDVRRRGKFLDEYVQNLIDRDVRQLTAIERAPQLTALIRVLAARSGLQVAPGSLESDLQISRPTVARYLRLLEEVFLVKRIPGWSRNLGTRATATPKLIYVDSGIAARLLALDSHALQRPGAPFGPLIEGFVLSELARQLTWSQELAELYHYRDHNKVEVDGVLENRRGHVIGIEVRPLLSSGPRTSADSGGLPRSLATTSSPVLSSTPAALRCLSGRSYAQYPSAPSGSSEPGFAGSHGNFAHRLSCATIRFAVLMMVPGRRCLRRRLTTSPVRTSVRTTLAGVGAGSPALSKYRIAF
jgi:predicted AAA+ superfamily ATPase